MIFYCPTSKQLFEMIGRMQLIDKCKTRYKSRRDERLIYWFLMDVSVEGGVRNGFLRSTCEAIKTALLSPTMQAAKEHIEVDNIYYYAITIPFIYLSIVGNNPMMIFNASCLGKDRITGL